MRSEPTEAPSEPVALVTGPVVRKKLVTVMLLAGMIISLLVAVPALRPVLREFRFIRSGWLGLGIALELASCLSFLVVFRWFFGEISVSSARRMAWTEMGSGALLPGGGVGRSPSVDGCCISLECRQS